MARIKNGNHKGNDSEHTYRLLIIDDDPGVRESFESIFDIPCLAGVDQQGALLFGPVSAPRLTRHARSYELTLCERGIDGIEEVKRSIHSSARIPVAFVDINMPGIDGVETARRMWNLDPQLKIVIITAYSKYRPEDILDITHRQDLFFLRKPFHPEEIRQMARALTHLWSLERAGEKLTANLSDANNQLLSLNLQLEKKVEEQTLLLLQSEKMASLGLLAAGVAHEINNPLAYIDSNLHTLNKYCSKVVTLLRAYEVVEETLFRHLIPEAIEPLQNIRTLKEEHQTAFILQDMTVLTQECLEGTRRVKQIVQDLRTFSRCDAPCPAAVHVNDIMDATLNIIWNQLKYKTHLVRHYSSLPPLMSVPQRLSQVFMNVLMNAAQAITDSGVVQITTEYLEAHGDVGRDGPWARIQICDDGCGIPKENLKRIFDPFFTTKPAGQGTGLGLSIVYDIVKQEGGYILVESEVGRGTTVTILLPYAKP